MDNVKKRIYLSSPHMTGDEQSYINEAFTTNWIAPLGPNVDAFEKELAEYVGIKGALALSSGTAAIHLALRLLGIGQGDIVFVSTLTFIGSINPILYLNAEPVFIDSEPNSWNMSPLALERALNDARKNNKLPKAIIIVNLYGQSADMKPILELANSYGIPLIEDAAESLGAYYKDKASGTFGKIGIYSFNGNKIVTTSGGGALVSDDLELINKGRFLSTQARDKAPYYQHSEMGYNYRLSNILAGIGRAQLKVIDERVNKRRLVFSNYLKALGQIEGVNFMPEIENGYSTRWLTALTIDINPPVSVLDIMDALERENIESRPIWKPMHLQPLFIAKKTLYYPHQENGSVSDYLFNNGICLPSGSNLEIEDQNKIIEIIKSLLNNN